MSKTIFKYIALAAHAFLALVLGTPAHAQLKTGQGAPDFTLAAALGGKDMSFSLAKALKKGPVVIFFYPKSFTAVCTEEAHLFAEAMSEFDSYQASVIGISADKIETQREFSTAECRDRFPVAADPEMKVIKAYQVAFGALGAVLPFADRVSFVIAPDGRILSQVKSSDASPHVQKSLEALRNWAAKRS
jgi:peroxiredoxin